MKGSFPGLIAALLTIVALFALAGFQITSAGPGMRLLGRQVAAMVEIDRWLPAHQEDLALLAKGRQDAVIPVSGLPIPVTVPAQLVTNGDPDALRRYVVRSMGSALYRDGSSAFKDDKGNSLKPSMTEPIRWSSEFLDKSAHGFWQVALALSLLLLVASMAAVLMGGGDVVTPVAMGAAFATAFSLAIWLLTQVAKGQLSAPSDQEMLLALRDGAWIGIRNAGAITVVMLGMRLLINTFAGRDSGWQQHGAVWDYDSDDADAPLFEPLRPSNLQRLRGWLQAAHPFPLLMVLCLTGLIGVASADAHGLPKRYGLMIAAMFFAQLVIGWTNDYIDRQSDEMYQPTKPIPSGVINANAVPSAIVVAIFSSFTLGTLLGWWPAILLAIGMAAGLAYDLILKDTRYSPIAFLVAFAVLPLYVWASLDVFRDTLLVLYLVGSPLVVAAHLANVLPDIETDTTAGRRNLGVILGRDRALSIVADSLAAPPLLIVATLPFIHYNRGELALTLFVYAACAAGAAFAYTRPGRDALVWGFRFVALGSVLFSAGWLAAV